MIIIMGVVCVHFNDIFDSNIVSYIDWVLWVLYKNIKLFY